MLIFLAAITTIGKASNPPGLRTGGLSSSAIIGTRIKNQAPCVESDPLRQFRFTTKLSVTDCALRAGSTHS
jgi:hypothetical protein